jgi:predicted nucleotidyltransferase
MERVLNQLVERLKKAYGDRLKSVILYGSAAVGDYHGKFSDLNVLCVLREVTPAELAASNPVARWWREQGNPSPLLLSEEEVRDSADCFPIEFHDIKERRRVLYGEDVVRELAIDTCFHRAQVEHELRAKLLRLRQKAAGVLTDPSLLRRLLADSISTFCALFRHALLLAGAEARFEKREVIEQARERFGIDPAPFARLLDLREEKVKPREVDPAPLLAEYLKQIQVVIDAVDALERT